MAAPPQPLIKAEYAGSDCSTCKSCGSIISKESFRIATQFEGFMPVWNHASCILKKKGQIKSLQDIEGLDNLRREDQKKLHAYVEGAAPGAVAEPTSDGVVGEYTIQIAKSSRATCKGCNEKIEKGQVRVSTMVSSDSSKFRGKVPAWRHAKCFFELNWRKGPLEELPGWEDLSNEDQAAVKELMSPGASNGKNVINSAEMPKQKDTKRKGTDQDEPPAGGQKKRAHKGEAKLATAKAQPVVDTKKDNDFEKQLEKQIKELSPGSSKGKNVINSVEMPKLKGTKRKVKDQDEPLAGEQKKRARKGEEGEAKLATAKAQPVIDAKKDNDFEKQLEKQSKELWSIEGNLKKHVDTNELRMMLEENEQDASGSEYDLRERCADGMLFGALGECPTCQGPLEFRGGQYKCKGNLSEWSKCMYTTHSPERLKGKWKIPEDLDNDYLKKWFKSQKAKKEKRLVSAAAENQVGSSGLKEVESKAQGGFLEGLKVAIVGKNIQTKWKHLIHERGGQVLKEKTSEIDCVITTEVELELEENKLKLQNALGLRIPIVKEEFLADCFDRGGLVPVNQYVLETAGKFASSVVHEDSGLQDVGHILEDDKTIYNTTLSLSDLSTEINSYYILQIIEHDSENVHHIFHRWGRVGSSKIGAFKLEKLSKSAAIHEFKKLFREKTGNAWEAWERKSNFQKQPNKFYPLEMVSEQFEKDIRMERRDDEPISLLGILGECTTSAWLREMEATMYLDSFIGHIPFVRSASTSGDSIDPTSFPKDWVMAARDFLFGADNYRIGRVVADDFSYSGSGWFYDKEYIVTCAHVVRKIQAMKKDILLQLPNRMLIDVEIIYLCPPDGLVLSYKMDVAILKLKHVRTTSSSMSLNDLPIAIIEAGELVWTSKCLTAGVLGTEAQHVLQNMLNVGRVETNSELLTTVSARADFGFSGGPVLNKSLKIIGMIQGGRGEEIKTVAIIPIEEIAKIISIVSASSPTLPRFPIPMQIDSTAVPF